jgi:POT family proton-dependent oligopeptide transporter
MWERFSFYGMRAILLLFMTAPAAAGGLGWDAAKAGPIYGLYTAMVYLTALPGGWIADRLIGQRRAVLFGGILIALGHLTLTVHNVGFFYTGLFLIICGTGLLKPNISTMVGALYSEDDKRRDAGFSIFYMGINLGAFISPLVCGFLAQDERFRGWLLSVGLRPESSWHWGFGAATVGMTIGLIQYTLGGRRLGSAGLKPAVPLEPAAHSRLRGRILIGLAAAIVLACLSAAMQAAGLLEISIERITSIVGYSLLIVPVVYFGYFFTNRHWSGVEKKRLGAILLFFLFAALFWSAFEQAGSSLNLFAERFTRNEILGFAFPASWLQSVNSIFIILLAPVFAWLWVTMGSREPSSPAKFSIGLFFVGLGFLVVACAAMLSGPAGVRVSPWWLITLYLCHTIGELCLSPVGLSTMTKLAPPRVVGQMMGIWFLALSVGNFIGGQVAGLFETLPLPKLFGAVVAVTMACTVICVIMIKPIRGLMGGVR